MCFFDAAEKVACASALSNTVYMLPKTERLTVPEVEHIFAHGKTARTSLFLVKYIRKETGTDKYAALAPKKSFLKAVERNALRRLIYAVLRTTRPPRGISALFIAQKGMKDADAPALTRELRKIQWENA